MVKAETHITHFPLPRLPHERAKRSLSWAVIREVGAQLCNGPAVYGNGPVYAVPADGSDPRTPARIRAIKGEQRRSNQPLGLTISFNRFLPYVDIEQIKHPKLRALFNNPTEVTRLFGGLAFVRARATEQAKTALPPCVISEDNGTVQNYSAIGNTRTSLFLMHAVRAGTKLPVMTSANRSGSHEIVDDEMAWQFAKSHGLPFAPNPTSFLASSKPKGSYPVVTVMPESLRVARQGFLSNGLMDALLAGYPVERFDMRPSAYPDNVLDVADLPLDQRDLKGSQLRKAILSYVTNGVTAEQL